MTTTNGESRGLSYRDAGVDIDAGNELVERIKPAVESTLRPEVIGGLGGFGSLFDLDPGKWKHPLLVSGTDGVGTKLLLARRLGRHDTIGIDLVAMCVNDILTCGAEPLFFLDYFAAGKLEVGHARTVIEGIAEGCREAGCALIGGETAEMPGLYAAGDYDLAGFVVGAVERERLLDGGRIGEAHRLLGLASSGLHSNGYSLVRAVLERSGADLDAAFDEGAGAARTLGEVLLTPTRIYVRSLLPLVNAGRVDGLAHITGGGLTENVLRMLPRGLAIRVRLDAWRRPAIFDWLQREGGIADAEMLRTFNCGIGMVAAVPPGESEAVRKEIDDRGIACFDIGEVTAGAGGVRVRFV